MTEIPAGQEILSVIGGPAKTTSDVVVELVDVSKSFGDLEVLRGVNLSVRGGECVCVIGPSGSGKSTLLRCINYLEDIDASGSVTVNGQRMGYSSRGGRWVKAREGEVARQRQEIGMVFQRFNLFPHMTALENVITGPVRVRGDDRRQAREVGAALLARVGLSDKLTAYPNQLSGGQQQRVAICRALAMRPTVMLFDEPTSALDPEMIGEVLAVIEELVVEGMTTIIVTHEMKFASRAAARVAMMDDGVIVEEAPPDQFFAAPSDERTRRFLSKLL